MGDGFEANPYPRPNASAAPSGWFHDDSGGPQYLKAWGWRSWPEHGISGILGVGNRTREHPVGGGGAAA